MHGCRQRQTRSWTVLSTDSPDFVTFLLLPSTHPASSKKRAWDCILFPESSSFPSLDLHGNFLFSLRLMTSSRKDSVRLVSSQAPPVLSVYSLKSCKLSSSCHLPPSTFSQSLTWLHLHTLQVCLFPGFSQDNPTFRRGREPRKDQRQRGERSLYPANKVDSHGFTIT